MGDTNREKAPEPSKPFVLPKHLVQELNEHTIGGFALFYFDPNTGYPRHLLSFDSPAHCLALQKYMQDWSTALQDLYLENTRRVIENNLKKEQEDEEDTGENET